MSIELVALLVSMGLLLVGLLTYSEKKRRDKERALREAATAQREQVRLEAEHRQRAVESTEKLRDNLKYRVEHEADALTRRPLEARLTATEEALTQVLQDVALNDLSFSYYYVHILRAPVSREIGPEAQLPEPVRETAVLAEAASQAAGATPQDAEGYLLQGNALYFLSERLEGEAGAQALASAIEAYDHALEVYTREALLHQWATILNNKANAFRNLGERLEGEAGDQALRDAIVAYDHALEVYTRETLPQQWATILSNKGNAFRNLGERLEGEAGARALTSAIEAYDHALEVRTRETLPQEWAMTLNNKGNALYFLSKHIEGTAIVEALRDAIEAYDHALEVRTRETLPQQWATTLNNKGNALRALGERLEGEAGAQALTSAIEAYDRALEVYTRDHFSFYHTLAQRNRDVARRLLEERKR